MTLDCFCCTRAEIVYKIQINNGDQHHEGFNNQGCKKGLQIRAAFSDKHNYIHLRAHTEGRGRCSALSQKNVDVNVQFNATWVSVLYLNKYIYIAYLKILEKITK